MLKEALKSSCFSRSHTIYEHLQKEVANEFICHITIYGDRTSFFEELLDKDGSVQKNYNLRHSSLFSISYFKTV